MNRKIGSTRWGVTPMIIMRDRSCCLIAKAMTVESKKPKDILHLWTIGEKGLSGVLRQFRKVSGFGKEAPARWCCKHRRTQFGELRYRSLRRKGDLRTPR